MLKDHSCNLLKNSPNNFLSKLILYAFWNEDGWEKMMGMQFFQIIVDIITNFPPNYFHLHFDCWFISMFFFLRFKGSLEIFLEMLMPIKKRTKGDEIHDQLMTFVGNLEL